MHEGNEGNEVRKRLCKHRNSDNVAAISLWGIRRTVSYKKNQQSLETREKPCQASSPSRLEPRQVCGVPRWMRCRCRRGVSQDTNLKSHNVCL